MLEIKDSKDNSIHIYKEHLPSEQTYKYITVEEALKIWNVDEPELFRRMAIILSIDTISVSNRKLYNKENMRLIQQEYNRIHENYMTNKEAESLIGRSLVSRIEKIKTPKYFGIILGIKDLKSTYLVKRDSVYEQKNIADSTEKSYNKSGASYSLLLTPEQKQQYVTPQEGMKIWSIDTQKKFTSISNNLNIDRITINNCNFYNIKELHDTLLKYNNLHKEYMPLKEAEELIGKSYASKLERFSAPHGYAFVGKNIIGYKQIESLVSRNEVNKINYTLDRIKNDKIQLYLDISETSSYLNLSKKRIPIVVREYNITTVKVPGQERTLLYLKQDLDRIKQMQVKFWEDHIESNEILGLYGKNINAVTTKVKIINTPSYAILLENPAKFCYPRKEVLDIINNISNIEEIRQISGDNSFETFFLKLESYNKWNNLKSSTYTKEKWLEFVKGKLSSSQAAPQTIEGDIRNYVTVSLWLNEMLEKYDVTEIYILTSFQINSSFKQYNNKTCKNILYSFLSQVNIDIKLLQISDIRNGIHGFRFENIINPRYDKKPSQPKKKNKTIYDFEMYSEVFKYCTNLPFHIEKSLQSIKEKNNILYLSVWLYVVLHLNNAWRHGDVANFPRIYMEDLLDEFEIKDIEWFSEHKLTLAQARKVITRVRYNEFKVSKTQVAGHFFCSDDLAPTVATIILMIETFMTSNASSPLIENEPLMKFYVKHNKTRDYMTYEFFQHMEIKDFAFKSKKMNKSVMSYIYYLSNISNDSEALKYVQYMRSHQSDSSPLFYINLDFNSLNTLSKQLFERGEFGFVSSLLINRLNASALDFKSETEQISWLNTSFGDSIKLESTAGFLNSIKNERNLVINLLMEKSLEECQVILTDMFAKNLPSRQSDVQCLVSKKGCQNPQLEGCFNCPYHIPSIYALTSLCNSLLDDLNNYNITLNKAKQLKLIINIHRKRIIFKEALAQFGREYTYNCLGLTKEELLDKLQVIPELEELKELI